MATAKARKSKAAHRKRFYYYVAAPINSLPKSDCRKLMNLLLKLRSGLPPEMRDKSLNFILDCYATKENEFFEDLQSAYQMCPPSLRDLSLQSLRRMLMASPAIQDKKRKKKGEQHTEKEEEGKRERPHVPLIPVYPKRNHSSEEIKRNKEKRKAILEKKSCGHDESI